MKYDARNPGPGYDTACSSVTSLYLYDHSNGKAITTNDLERFPAAMHVMCQLRSATPGRVRHRNAQNTLQCNWEGRIDVCLQES